VTISLDKKFELMLTGRAKADSSSCPQALTHHSTNRARRRVTLFQPKRATNYATNVSNVAPPCEWYRLAQPDIAKKIRKTPYFGVQGHWIRRQSTASVRFPISD